MPVWLLAYFERGLIMGVLKNVFLAIFSKERVIGWGAGIAIAATAALAGMQSKQVKEAVCGATVIEVPAPTPAPQK
jgi:hypothetical protein